MTVTVSSNDVLINTLQKAAFEQAIEATLLLTEQANSPTFPVTSSAINVLGKFAALSFAFQSYVNADGTALNDGNRANWLAEKSAVFGIAAGVTGLIVLAAPIEIPALIGAGLAFEAASAWLSSASILAQLLNVIYPHGYDP